MNHVDFTTALIRLSRHKVGVQEACTLFMLAEETTAANIAAGLKVGKDLIKARIGILRNKKLVESSYRPDGSVRYRLTPRGRAIITSTLKTKPTDQ